MSNDNTSGYTFREEAKPLRLRISPEDLELVSEIQEYHESIKKPKSLEFLVSEAIRAYHDLLADEGHLEPR